MATVRVFVALMLAQELGEQVASAVREALGPKAERDYRLPRPDGLHLTLFFLGDVDAALADDLEPLLSEELAGARAPRMCIDHVGAFPRRGRERVLWVGVSEENPGGLEELCQRTIRAVERGGLLGKGDQSRSRDVPFRPHVTVARPRERVRVPEDFYGLSTGRPGGPMEPVEPVEPGEPVEYEKLGQVWCPQTVALVESVRGSGPSVYRPRIEIPLSGAG